MTDVEEAPEAEPIEQLSEAEYNELLHVPGPEVQDIDPEAYNDDGDDEVEEVDDDEVNESNFADFLSPGGTPESNINVIMDQLGKDGLLSDQAQEQWDEEPPSPVSGFEE